MVVEEVVKFGVAGDAVEDGEEGVGLVGAGFGVFGVVEVDVPVVVEAGCEGERFDGYGAGAQFLGVAEVNKRVS